MQRGREGRSHCAIKTSFQKNIFRGKEGEVNDAITSVPIAATEGAEEAICLAEEGDALGIYHRHQSAVAVN